ncbi:MAG: Si-specific NAD(P)(+) transhydrogenase [Phycisphaeraceae bacterium]|nr:MAG: Si-specific NAD(P)(+) transhydrogenase [Phycisphaeraceae bacterium]
MDRYDLICLGCGPAGEKAATQAAYFGRRVAVIERAHAPGGAMVNTGTIPSKALRETAVMCSAFRRRPIPGLRVEFGGHLSIAGFMAQRHLIQQEEHDRIESSFDRHGITVVNGHGRIVDPHTIEVTRDDGPTARLSADFILVATGSSPVRPEHIPFHLPGVVDADGILELEHMPRSLAIVGGGVIGCEYASIFAEIGVAVTLFEPRESILPFIDGDCRDVLLRSMRGAEIDVRLNTAVQSVSESKVGGVLVTDSTRRAESFDVLLWAAGRSGNTRDIGLENVGLIPDKRGLLAVDGTFRTSVPSIYAAGDVIGPPSLTSVSMEQGRVAACHMFGLHFKREVARTFPIGLYTIPPVAMVGLGEQEAAKQGHEVIVGKAPYRLNARGRMYRDNEGLLKLVFDRSSRRLLGAAMVGEQATELIHLAQSIIHAGEGIDYLINACFNYPSISELYKYAAYAALQAIHVGEQRLAA